VEHGKRKMKHAFVQSMCDHLRRVTMDVGDVNGHGDELPNSQAGFHGWRGEILEETSIHRIGVFCIFRFQSI
jgi:hypothetical protein